MNYREITRFSGVPLGELIDQMKDIEDKLENLGEVHRILYRSIMEEMEEQGATIARSETNVAKLTPRVTYNSTILAKLREITDPEDLIGVYKPEHEEVRRVPEKWNMSKGRKLLKLGHEHQAIIDDAKQFGLPGLTVYKRETSKEALSG